MGYFNIMLSGIYPANIIASYQFQVKAVNIERIALVNYEERNSEDGLKKGINIL